MSPENQTLVWQVVLTLLSSQAFGVLVNVLIARASRQHTRWGRFCAAFLANLPSLVAPLGAAVDPTKTPAQRKTATAQAIQAGVVVADVALVESGKEEVP